MKTMFRIADKNDLYAIVALLIEDELGANREKLTTPLPQAYQKAMDEIQKDANQQLIVLEQEKLGIIGVLQLTFIPSLTYCGSLRAQIEGVRIHAAKRGLGLGEKMIEYAIAQAKKKGAKIVQLTTDLKRKKAIAFYRSLGFVSSHSGMKLHLGAD